MSTTQSIYKNSWQLEPQRNRVETTLAENRKLVPNKEEQKWYHSYTWEDFRGLSFVSDEESI